MPSILVGTVTGPLARATLAIGDEHHHRRIRDHVAISVDGVEHPLEVSTPEVLGQRAITDRWGDLTSDPRAQLFLDVAPGDHVTCELAGWLVDPGTRVVVAVDQGRVVMLAVVEDGDAQTRAA